MTPEQGIGFPLIALPWSVLFWRQLRVPKLASNDPINGLEGLGIIGFRIGFCNGPYKA